LQADVERLEARVRELEGEVVSCERERAAARELLRSSHKELADTQEALQAAERGASAAITRLELELAEARVGGSSVQEVRDGLAREISRKEAENDQLNVLLEQSWRLGEEERDRAYNVSEMMDRVRDENRGLFRTLNQARTQIIELEQLVAKQQGEMTNMQTALENCHSELASSRDRGVMLSERQRRAKLALEDTLRVVHEVEVKLKGHQLDVHKFLDEVRKSNLAEKLLDFHKERYPQDRVDAARFKGLTNAVQRDIKEYVSSNVREFGTSMGAEGKTLKTISKLLHKTIAGMI